LNEHDWEQLAKVLGIADLTTRVPEGAKLRFELGSMPQNQAALMTLLAAAALVGLVFYVYKREGQAALWKKLALAGIRAVVIGLVFLVLLEPRLAVDVEQTDHANTIVLWDESLSMSLPDRYLDEVRRKAVAEAAGLNPNASASVTSGVTTLSRQEIAWKIVERAKLLPRLEEKNRVKVYAFGDDARVLAPEKITLADLKPKGPATDLARAVRRALDEQAGRSVAAFVAITDGRANKGEGPKAVAAELKERGIPFYAIGIGDPTAPKNLELAELICNERAYKNDPLLIEGRVRHRGYEGEKVDVEFYWAPADAPQKAEKIRTETVELHADGTAEKVTFTYLPKEVGRYVVTLKVPPRDEELIKEDNQRSAPVAVIDDETRVLLIAGSPSYEYRHLKNLLMRDKTIQIKCYLQSADETFPQETNTANRLDSIPRAKEAINAFDVICLIDPNPAGFDREIMESIVNFVEKQGGGLLYVAGEKYTTSFFRTDDLRPMLDLIPVVPDLDRSDTEGHGPWTEAWPYKLTDEAEDSAITRLDQSLQRSKAIWPKLPGAFWHYPVSREKPGAAVLVRHADQRSSGREPPLIVTHFYGPGRTLFNATDETWRWRAVAPKAYDRFWVQALRFLVEGKLQGGARRVELVVDKNEYSLGEPVRIRARAKDSRAKPLELKELTVQARTQDGDVTSIPIKLTEGRPGHYEGTYLPEGRGTIDLSLRLPDFTADEKAATVPITVRLPDLEFANPRLDEELLNEIVLQTGGALVAFVPEKEKPQLVTVQNLPDKIPSGSVTLLKAGTPVPLWDNRATLILAVGLLGLEWFLRKRLRMV
jgi:uncharacterized membrane protein